LPDIVSETLNAAPVLMRCDCCDEMSVKESMEWETFQYGSGPNLVLLKAYVPVLYCASCDEGYTDYRGEEMRSLALQEHLQKLKFPT
jgi:hypothetical protein